MASRIATFIVLVCLLFCGCSDKSVAPELTGTLKGMITVDGQGTDGVIIDVSVFQISGEQGNSKVIQTERVSAAGEYSIDLSAGTYRADFTYYSYGEEVITTARYPIIIATDRETIVDVEMKDHVPHSFLAVDGNAAVELSWENSYAAIHYNLYRSDSSRTNFQIIAQIDPCVGTVYYTDQPPTVGTYYYYATAIYGGDLESDYESIKRVDFTADIRPPSGLTAIDLVEYISLNWNENERAYIYRVYRSLEANQHWVLVDSTSENHYNDVPPALMVYNYRLTAVSIYHTESSPSAVVSVNFDGRFDPPAGLDIVDRGSDLYLSWLEYDNVAYYSVYRSDNNDDNFRLINTATSPYFADTPAGPGVYYYYITATAANDLESDPSEIVNSHYDGVLEYPAGFIAVNMGLHVELGWEEVPWAGAYLIFRSDDGEIYVEIARLAGTVISFDDRPLYAGLYYYRIATETITGTRGELSDPVSVEYSNNLLAPTGISAENLGTSVRITWNELEDADGYKLYRARTETGSYEYVDSTAEIFYIDIPPIGGSYYYKVSAYDILGHESPLSNSAYVHFDANPLPPYNIAVVDSVYKVYLWWESIEPVADFMIYRSTTMDNNYTLIQTTSDFWAYDWPSFGGHYFYKLRTVVGSDTSDFSEFNHVLFSGILQPPADLSAVDAGTHIHLDWLAPPGAAYYEVYRGDSIDGEYDRIMTVYESSADDAPDSGGIYFFKVKAFTQGDLASPFAGPVQVEFEP